jgi:hypothetical protein
MRRVALLVLLVAGCGRSTHVDSASPQVLRVHWQERDGGVVVVVRSIAVTADGWRVDATVTNRRRSSLDVTFPHQAGHTRFGLLVSKRRELPRTRWFRDLTSPFYEQNEQPAVPTTLGPGESWSGTFSGLGRPPRGAYLRVIFGRFVPPGRPAEGFLVVTRHVVRLAR